ncbi:hypothetical protein ABIF03_001046 [Bradyrhizobium elkanii]
MPDEGVRGAEGLGRIEGRGGVREAAGDDLQGVRDPLGRCAVERRYRAFCRGVFSTLGDSLGGGFAGCFTGRFLWLFSAFVQFLTAQPYRAGGGPASALNEGALTLQLGPRPL